MARKQLKQDFKVIRGGNSKKISNNKIKRWTMYSILAIFAFAFLSYSINSLQDYITAKMINVEIVEINSVNEGVYGMGFYIREEVVLQGSPLISQDDLPHLTRVRKGQNLTGNVIAPMSGLIMYYSDGYESYDPQINNSISAVFQQFDEDIAQEVVLREEKVKIVNNYVTDIIVKVPGESGQLLEDKSTVKVRLGDEDSSSQIVWVDVKEVKEQGDYTFIHLFSDQLTDDLIEVRFSEVFFILDTITGIKLPKEALVTKQDKVGVYSLNRNRVVFREVAVVKEEEEDVWVIGLTDNQEVILNPRIVSPGQTIKY